MTLLFGAALCLMGLRFWSVRSATTPGARADAMLITVGVVVVVVAVGSAAGMVAAAAAAARLKMRWRS